MTTLLNYPQLSGCITLVLIPLIGIVGVLLAKNKEREFALIASILTLIESIRVWLSLEMGTAEFQQIVAIHWIDSPLWDLKITFGIDGISIIFVLLTTLLFPICILASWDYISFARKEFYVALLSIEILLVGVFTVLDLLGFYILFEGVLIPMFLIIGVWGAREQKITAAYYFFFYTLIGSVLMLLSIFYIYYVTGTTDYQTLLGINFPAEIQNLLFLGFFASLAVKIPKFPFHVWLPQAHVEAPLAGSVLLAGVLIKLGSYGFIRFTLPLFPDACVYFTPLVFTLGTLAVIYASLTTLRQTDLKRIIAYSSVSHMGVVSLAIFTFTLIGLQGSIFLQISHGLVSSALFIVVTILYDRHHTRLVKYYRGVAVTMPIFATIFFFFTLANIAVPLSCNFVGEFLSLLATFNANAFIGILASSGMVLSACYALFLYNRVCFGSMSPYIGPEAHNRDISRREFFVLLPLVLLTLFLGVYPNIILDQTLPCVLNILDYLA
jgi:NADH-quinone oxidoreductase subunit M